MGGQFGNGYVYLIEEWSADRGKMVYKIGASTDPDQRTRLLRNQAKQFKTEGPGLGQRTPRRFLRNVLKVLVCVDYQHAEKWLHRRYADKRFHKIEGEAEDRESGYTEWFELSAEDVAEICAIAYGDEIAFPELPPSRKTATVTVSAETSRMVGKYIARRNWGVKDHKDRITKQKVIDQALLEYFASRKIEM